MDADDTPIPGEIPCAQADRWEDFTAALNSLSRFAAIEANRLRSREYERLRKQHQRHAQKGSAPTHDRDAARLTG